MNGNSFSILTFKIVNVTIVREFYNSLVVCEEELDTYKGKLRGVSFTFTPDTNASWIDLIDYTLEPAVPRRHYHTKVDSDSVAFDMCSRLGPWKDGGHLIRSDISYGPLGTKPIDITLVMLHATARVVRGKVTYGMAFGYFITQYLRSLGIEKVISDAHPDELAKLSKPITKATTTHSVAHVSKQKCFTGTGISVEALEPSPPVAPDDVCELPMEVSDLARLSKAIKLLWVNVPNLTETHETRWEEQQQYNDTLMEFQHVQVTAH
ncbi:hypothetical protein U1Q18_046485 [Sarracenia purpurea var. burkii]